MKNRKRKSVVPIYLSAVVWPLLGLVCPGILLKWQGLIAAALLSACVYQLSARKAGKRIRVKPAFSAQIPGDAVSEKNTSPELPNQQKQAAQAGS